MMSNTFWCPFLVLKLFEVIFFIILLLCQDYQTASAAMRFLRSNSIA
jgi:hypothetical protein